MKLSDLKSSDSKKLKVLIMKYLNLYKNPLFYVSVFFTAYFFYFLFVLNPPLYLIKNYREFFTDIYFFRQYFDFPGNPAEYISRFLTQLFIIPTLASLIVSAILWSIYWLGFYSFRKDKNNFLLPFLPVLVLIVMHNNYSHSMKFDVDLVFLLLSAFIFFRIFRKSEWTGFFLFPLILSSLFFINGLMTTLLFCLLALVSVFVFKKKIFYFPLFLFEILSVWILFHFIFSYSTHDLSKEFDDILLVYSAWYLPFILYISVLLSFVFNDFFYIRLINNSGKPDLRKNILVTTSFVLFSIALIFLTFSNKQKMILSVQNEGLNRNWNQVLVYSGKCDFPDKNVACYTNEALFHTGHLTEELFQYNQAFGSEGLMSTEIADYSEIVPNQQVFMDLGALSLSVVRGTEGTNIYGANPVVLKNMTKAYLAEGCIKEAQKILNLLDHTLFNYEWVQQYQKLVDDTTLIKFNPELNAYKKVQLQEAIVSKTSVELNLYALSRTSNTNKMAFDYLLISTLLDNKMQDFGTCLTGLKTFGYSVIPKIYFEGLLYYSLYSEYCPIDINEFSYDQNIIKKFREFRHDYSALKSNPEEARKQLDVKYGDTYWYYVVFQSPIPDNVRKDVSARLTL